MTASYLSKRVTTTSSRATWIVFEGIEGAGKSTLVADTAKLLQLQGLEVMTTFEPGSTLIGDELRKGLLSVNNVSMSAETEVLLFMAARAESMEHVPNILKEYDVLLTDRHVESTLAYSGSGHGLDDYRLRVVNGWITRGIRPDLTIYIDIPVEESRRRKDGALLDRIERLDDAFYGRVRQGYWELSRNPWSRRYVMVDGTVPYMEMFEQVARYVMEEVFILPEATHL